MHVSILLAELLFHFGKSLPLRNELGARSLIESRVLAKTGLNDFPSM